MRDAFSGSRRHHIRNRAIGCFLHSGYKANNHVSPTCCRRSSAARRSEGTRSFHRTGTSKDSSSMTTHDDSVFTICATVSHRFSSASEPIQKTVQTLLLHSDVKLTLQVYTHAVRRDRMTRSIPRPFNAISPTLTTNVRRTFIRQEFSRSAHRSPRARRWLLDP